MHDLVISGKVVDPIDGMYSASIGISKGKIEKISNCGLEGKETLHLTSSQMLFPGFIDPHVHMRCPGWDYKEDFLSGSRAAIHGGVTAVGDMPNLPQPVVTKEWLLRKMQLASVAAVDVLHLGGVNKDNLSDAKKISPLVPAFKIYTAESTGAPANEWEQIEAATKLISRLKKPITFHCEDQGIINKAKKDLGGKSYPWKHCDERPKEAEIEAIKSVISLCRKYLTMANIAHISAKESLKIIGENRDIGVMCEVTPHHLYFTKRDMKDLGSLLKINCPLREESDRKYLLNAVAKGRIDMLATDHAPHTLDEKKSANPPSGMPGLDTYGNFVLYLMINHGVKPQLLARLTSYSAARYFQLVDRGRIEKGFAASLTILDKKGRTKIRKEDLQTKCKWSPFEGVVFPGRVVATIVRGKAYRNH